MRTAVRTVCAVMIVGAAVTIVSAQSMKPDRAIKYRQGIMQAIGWNMGQMGAMVKGERPYNKEEFLTRATYVDQLIRMPWEGFAPGSDQGAPTKAKPEIWKDMAKFKQHSEKAQGETPKLVAAAKTGDLNQIKAAMGDTGKACAACHDDFRAE